MNSKWFAYGMTHEQADLNLLLFPFAGGCPSVFVQWKRLLSAKVNVYPVLYPFREARRSEQLPDTVQQQMKLYSPANTPSLHTVPVHPLPMRPFWQQSSCMARSRSG